MKIFEEIQRNLVVGEEYGQNDI